MKDNTVLWNVNLFETIRDSDTGSLLVEAMEFADRHPEILAKIEADLDAHGLEKKEARRRDREYARRVSEAVSGQGALPLEGGSGGAAPDAVLGRGRPRMPARLVLAMLVLRGAWGSMTDRAACDRMAESVSLHCLASTLGCRLPRRSAICENLGAVSAATLERVMALQLRDALGEGLDDFALAAVDSTAVAADMEFPTDTRLVAVSCARLVAVLEKQTGLRLGAFRANAWQRRWLADVGKAAARIAMSHADATGDKFRKSVRAMVADACKLVDSLEIPFEALEKAAADVVRDGRGLPERKALERLAEHARFARAACFHGVWQLSERVLKKRRLAADEKYLGPADADARIVVKGQRNPVIGYHPQVVRSGNGFVTALLVGPEYVSDAASFIPALEKSAEATGVVPASVTADDGYTSAANRRAARKLGVGKVSFGGSKGRRLMRGEWNLPEFRLLRNLRSPVESLVYTLKWAHGLGRMRRTGLSDVRAEMLEKAVAYNFGRALLLREREAKRREEEKRKADGARKAS